MYPWWFFAICSAVFSSLFTIFRKKGTLKEHALEFEVVRTTTVAFLCLFLIPFLTFKYSITSILIIYFTSLLAVLGILLNSKALKHLQISTVAPLFNLTPGFLAILAFLFLGESLSKIQVGGLILLIVGAYVLETDHHSFIKSFLQHIKSKYVGYAIASALVFSITALLDKYIITFYAVAFDYLFLVWFCIAINFILLSFIQKKGIKGVKHCLRKSKHNVFLAGLFSFLGNVFYVAALSLSYVSLVMPIRRLSTLISTIVGGELFHEKNLLRKSFACVIMVVGAYLIIV